MEYKIEERDQMFRLQRTKTKELKKWFKDQGYSVGFPRSTTANIIDHKTHSVTAQLKWMSGIGGVPWFAGPTAYAIGDLNNILPAIRANSETISFVRKAWEEFSSKRSQKTRMQYQGTQCLFYHKANLLGDVLDDIEELKKLALKAADLLWDRKRNMPYHKKASIFTDYNKINQEIYELLGQMRYPEKEKP